MGNEMNDFFFIQVKETKERYDCLNVWFLKNSFFCGWNQLMSQIALIVVERSIIPLNVCYTYISTDSTISIVLCYRNYRFRVV